MNLNQLKYFQAVCIYQSLTLAAEYLHISQPSISAAIKDLEEEFHVVLFKRKYRGISLTPEGQKLYELANDLLGQAEQIRNVMLDIRQQRQILRLGISPMIGSVLMARLMQEYVGQSSRKSIHIVEAGQSEIIDMLNKAELDLALLPHRAPLGSEFQTKHVMNLETVCCVSLYHPLVNRKSVTVEDLRDIPMVLSKNGYFLTEQIQQLFAIKNCTPNILLYTEQLATITRLVSSNIAVSFLFRQIADHMRSLVSIPMDPPMTAEVSLVWKNNGYLFPEMQRFIEYINGSHFDEK